MTICPSCGSNRVHRSRTRGFVERIRRQFSQKRVFRCDGCGWRGWGIETSRPHHGEQILATEADPVDLDAIDRTLGESQGGQPAAGGQG